MRNIYPLMLLASSIFILSSCWQQEQTPPSRVNNTPSNSNNFQPDIATTGSTMDINTPSPANSGNITSPPTSTKGEVYKINISQSGFTPDKLTITIGDTVDFINIDTSPHWPASANHPTHTVYPGSDIEKCGTAEQQGILDACKGLTPGEIFSFTFTEKWTWWYHDHLNPKLVGTIIVQ